MLFVVPYCITAATKLTTHLQSNNNNNKKKKKNAKRISNCCHFHHLATQQKKQIAFFVAVFPLLTNRDGAVGIAAGYELDDRKGGVRAAIR
jgi:hypothetical protein